MSDDLRKRIPPGATVTTKFNADYDRLPDTVTYPGEDGKTRTVKMKQTMDGDYIPETGHTPDGDFNWPGKKLDW